MHRPLAVPQINAKRDRLPVPLIQFKGYIMIITTGDKMSYQIDAKDKMVHCNDVNAVLDGISDIVPICKSDRDLINELHMDRAGLLEFITVVLFEQ